MAENFIVSARKYRPQSWGTVVGQSSITAPLQSAIAKSQIAQAYLFCGPRGVGKTTCARIFAKEINVEAQAEDQDLSFNVFELDAASNNSVEDIRSITDQVRIPPQLGKYKVYIIDEVHMLSQAAFNAFLKTLEEPPPHAIFILATTEKHKIIPTILSRCQIFDFSRIKVNDISGHLASIAEQENVKTDAEGLHVIAQKADGAMRDALSIFDQIVAFSGDEVTYEKVIENLNVLDYEYYFRFADCIVKEDISSSLVLFNDVLDKGFDGHQVIIGLGEHLRNLMVGKDDSTLSLMEVTESIAQRYREQAEALDIRTLVKALDFINQCDVHYRTAKNQRLVVELCLMQLCSIKYNEAEKKNSDFFLKPPGLVEEGGSGILSQLPENPASPEVQAEQKGALPPLEIHEEFQEPISPELEIINELPLVEEAPIPVAAEISPPTPPAAKPLVPDERFKSESKVVTTSVSLSNLFEDTGVSTEKVEEKITFEEPKLLNDFSVDEFNAAWKTYADRQLEGDKRSVYATLMSDIPHCLENIITLKLSNTVQMMEIDVVKSDLMEFLRKRLKNTELRLNTILVKDESAKLKYYTDKDKYDAMVKQNESLDYFRKRLNLDLDF